MMNLQNLDGSQLAKLLNEFDSKGEMADAILIEAIMDFRYEVGYKNQLLTDNK